MYPTESSSKAQQQDIYFINHNNEVDSSSLYDFVMKSAKQTTSPRGIENIYFYEQDEESEIWEVKEWQPGKRTGTVLECYKTESEAADDVYTRIYNFHFMPDDQRDTNYWLTEDEAVAELKERLVK